MLSIKEVKVIRAFLLDVVGRTILNLTNSGPRTLILILLSLSTNRLLFSPPKCSEPYICTSCALTNFTQCTSIRILERDFPSTPYVKWHSSCNTHETHYIFICSLSIFPHRNIGSTRAGTLFCAMLSPQNMEEY